MGSISSGSCSFVFFLQVPSTGIIQTNEQNTRDIYEKIMNNVLMVSVQPRARFVIESLRRSKWYFSRI